MKKLERLAKKDLPVYELKVIIHLRIDEIIHEGKVLSFGIQQGFLELYFVNAKMHRENWTLVHIYDENIIVEGEANRSIKGKVESSLSLTK